MQLSLTGEKKHIWFCIHCNYHGLECEKEGEHNLCPKCGWVVYNEIEVREHFLNSNVYPKLVKNYYKEFERRDDNEY